MEAVGSSTFHTKHHGCDVFDRGSSTHIRLVIVMAPIPEILLFKDVPDDRQHPLGHCHCGVHIIELYLYFLEGLFDIIGDFASLCTCCWNVNVFAACEVEVPSLYQADHSIFFQFLVHFRMVGNKHLFRRQHDYVSFYLIELLHAQIKHSMDFVSRVIISQGHFAWWSKLPAHLLIVILEPYSHFLFAHHFVSFIHGFAGYNAPIAFLFIRLMALHKTSGIFAVIVGVANLVVFASQVSKNPRRNLPIIWTFLVIKYWKVVLVLLNCYWHHVMIFWTCNI